MVGKTYPSEKFTFQDPETRADITQLTSVGSTNRTLYFTNRPYVFGGEQIVFLSDRTGKKEMFMVDPKSGKIVQLTHESGITGNVSSCVNAVKNELYFNSGGTTITRVKLDTMKTEPLLRAPEGFGVGILNMSCPPWLAYECIQRYPSGTTQLSKNPAAPASKPAGRESFYMRPHTLIYRYNTETDELDCVWGDYRMYTHVQICPTNENFIIFSDWLGYGPDGDRCVYYNCSRRVKGKAMPTFPESMTARAGHESFTRKGNLYAQWMEGDLEREAHHTLYHAFLKTGDAPLATFDTDRARLFERYELPERNKDLMHHFTMSNDEAWGVHDRWPAAKEWDDNISHLSIFRHQKTQPQTIVKKLCFHNGHKGDVINLGAELTIDDKDERGTYTSFLKGSANVCQVDLRPFVDQIMKATESDGPGSRQP